MKSSGMVLRSVSKQMGSILHFNATGIQTVIDVMSSWKKTVI